jgi:hypothetical protein
MYFKNEKGCMLNTDPSARPNINEIIYHLENISQTRSIQLSESLTFLRKTESMLHAQFSPTQVQSSASAGPNSSSAAPAVLSQNANSALGGQSASTSNSHWAGNASSIFKGGNSFFKTIKDASSKVLDTVQQ